MGLTDQQVLQLIDHPHVAKTYAVIFTPTIIFQCFVAYGFYDHNVVAVPYENGTGSPADVIDGMVAYVYIGQEASGTPVGKVRAKGADSSYIYIAENDEITFDDSQMIVVRDEIPFWTKFPTCDVSGDEPVFYKDYDIEYDYQNDLPPPVPILGPALRVVVQSESTTTTWNASLSYSPRTEGSIPTYAWEFEGGYPVSSSEPSEDVSYASPGVYRTKLTITDNYGKTSVAYRWVRVLATPNDASVIQCTTTLQADFAQGGWKATIRGYTNMNLTATPDRSLVAVICENLAGDGNPFEFGGFPDTYNVYFCGYLQRDTVSQVPGSEIVSFEATTIERVMSETFGFDAFIVDIGQTSMSWIEMNGVNIRKAANHLIRWQSNLMEIADVHLPDDDTPAAGVDMPQGDFYSQLKNMCQSLRLHVVGCSRYGAVHMQPDVQHLKWPERYDYEKEFVMPFELWSGSKPVQIPRLHSRKVSMLECAGVQWGGPGTDPIPHFSRAPGIVPVNEGKIEEISGLATTGEDDLNTLCGMVYAEKTNTATDISMDMAGNLMPAADIFPQHMIQVPDAFQVRGESWYNEWIVVRGIKFSVTEGGAPQTSWVIDKMCQEATARPFWYPQEPIVLPPPPYPPPPPPPPPLPPPEGFPGSVIVLHRYGLWEADISVASPVWSSLNTNLGATFSAHSVWFARDPEYPNSVGYLALRDGIYRNDGLNVGGDWVQKLTKAAAMTMMNDSVGGGGGNIYDCDFRKLKPQVSRPGAIYVAAAGRFYGLQDWKTIFIFASFDRGETWNHSHYLGDRCTSYYGYEWWCELQSWASGNNEGQLMPSHHDPRRVYVVGHSFAGTAASRPEVWKLYDGDFDHDMSWEMNSNSSWGNAVTAHIPYKNNPEDQLIYVSRWPPTMGLSKFVSGCWTSDEQWRECGPRKAYWETPINLMSPTGIDVVSPTQMGTFTYDKEYFWAGDYHDNRFIFSENGGEDWTFLTEIPEEANWATGCCSGFPYDKSLFIVGRNPNYKAATETYPQMLYYSINGGVDWIHATGDLFTKTSGGGLRCIAPRWK